MRIGRLNSSQKDWGQRCKIAIFIGLPFSLIFDPGGIICL